MNFFGCRPKCKKFRTFPVSDRMRSSFRPRCAALFRSRGPAWRSADQVQIFSTSLRLQVRTWFSRSGSVRSLRPFRSLLSYTPLLPVLAVHAMMIMPQLPTPEPYNPLLSSASPRSVVPSCWPAQSPPASSACARASVRASFRPALADLHAQRSGTLPL